jgi:hypothetical protein
MQMGGVQRLWLGLLVVSVAGYNYGAQVSLGSEEFSAPKCEQAADCLSCSFHEVRTLDECRVSGYFQSTPCQMVDLRTNTTKQVTYISACSPEYASLLSPFSWFQVVMVGTALWFLRAWKGLRKVQRASYEMKLKKIISM